MFLIGVAPLFSHDLQAIYKSEQPLQQHEKIGSRAARGDNRSDLKEPIQRDLHLRWLERQLGLLHSTFFNEHFPLLGGNTPLGASSARKNSQPNMPLNVAGMSDLSLISE